MNTSQGDQSTLRVTIAVCMLATNSLCCLTLVRRVGAWLRNRVTAVEVNPNSKEYTTLTCYDCTWISKATFSARQTACFRPTKRHRWQWERNDTGGTSIQESKSPLTFALAWNTKCLCRPPQTKACRAFVPLSTVSPDSLLCSHRCYYWCQRSPPSSNVWIQDNGLLNQD